MPNISIPAQNTADPLGYALQKLSPQIGPAAGGYVRSVYQSLRVPLRVAEAARYRTAQINGCLVCQDFRAGDHLDSYLESVGGDAERSLVARGGDKPDESFYAAVADWRNADCFSEQERLAIELAERMGQQPDALGYDSDFWARMHDAFTEDEITDLTLAVGCWIATGRFTHVLGLDTV